MVSFEGSLNSSKAPFEVPVGGFTDVEGLGSRV